MTTWGDIKLRTLQKLFATNNGSTVIPTDNSSREYISAMPGAANEALALLATSGKYIRKSIDITHIPVKNLISESEKIHDLESGSISFEAENAHSLYFEIKGKGVLTVNIGGEITTEDFDTIATGFGLVTFKRILTNPLNQKVVVTFTSNYPMRVANVALYAASYETEAEIPQFADYVRYNLSEMVNDFYKIDIEHVIYEGNTIPKYKATSDFFQESYDVLVLPRDMKGNFKIYYFAYPQHLTVDTPDDEVLSLAPEIEAILPLYMASQLYKDDDAGIATTYRNEFEVARTELDKDVGAPSSEHFTSVSGWI